MREKDENYFANTTHSKKTSSAAATAAMLLHNTDFAYDKAPRGVG